MPSPEATATAAAHVRFARAYAAERLPWFAPALFRCRIVITPDVDVAAVDLAYTVYWNPTVVLAIWEAGDRAMALAELAFLWVHEISHRLRQHAERARELAGGGPAVDARRWNVACDFEINDSNWAGLRMPAAYPGMLPEPAGLAAGELAETYYRAITDGAAELRALPPDEGSGVHAQPRPWEPDEPKPTSELDQELIRREVARRMREAGVNPGGGWQRWAAETLRSRTDWRRRLGHRLSVSLQRGIGARIDYSFTRANRRQSVYHPVLAPALYGDRTARIAVVIDTSGSMREEQLAYALREVAAVLRTFEYPVTLIPCDARAYAPVRVVAAAEAMSVRELPGGGGTDLRAGISAALLLRPRPDSILVLTDGYTPYPTRRAPVPVIFGILQTEAAPARFLPTNPPWTADTVVLINLDPEPWP